MSRILRAALIGFCLLTLPVSTLAQDKPLSDLPPEQLQQLVREVFSSESVIRTGALDALKERGNPDVVAALIQALRFVPKAEDVNETLMALAADGPGTTWHDWMLWQEAHPEIEPFAGFDAFKADVMAFIDPNFRLFLGPGVKHDIRLEEIAWGGVRKDGIPALTNPTHVAAAEAEYLEDDELVFGVEVNGDARAYPLRILDWHEMFNDIVGGVHLALANCTLCGSDILYETNLPPRREPFIFGSSGFLYRSNKLMYDDQTHSLWNQFTGRPVVGPLTGSGIELRMRPVAITSWKDWLKRHPDTKVLSLDTGFPRDYTPGRPYGKYFASPDLMFPALVPDRQLNPKDFVFALRADGHEKAWPLSAFAGGRVINDAVGGLDVVLIGNAATRTVRAYGAGGREFDAVADPIERVVAGGEIWSVEEDALVGTSGQRLPRLSGHIAYWFAWKGFKPDAELYRE